MYVFIGIFKSLIQNLYDAAEQLHCHFFTSSKAAKFGTFLRYFFDIENIILTIERTKRGYVIYLSFFRMK